MVRCCVAVSVLFVHTNAHTEVRPCGMILRVECRLVLQVHGLLLIVRRLVCPNVHLQIGVCLYVKVFSGGKIWW